MDPIFDDKDPFRFLSESNPPSEPPKEPPSTGGSPDGEGNGDDGEEASNEPKTHRDLQRGALQDLLELTTQCAQREAEIEQKFQSTSSEAQGTGHRKLSEAERKYKGYQEQIAAKIEEKQAQINAQHQKAIASLKAGDQNLRHRARAEYEQAQQQARKDYDQATWLAESVLEAAEQKASQELKNATELNATQTEFVDTKEGEQSSLMARYNQRPPPGEALAAIKDAEATLNPVESFNQHKEVIERQIRALADLAIPKLFVGATPFLIGLLAVAIAAAIPQVIAGTLIPQWPQMGSWAGGMIVALIVFFLVMRSLARKQVVAVFAPLRRALDAARIANDNMISQATLKHDDDLTHAKRSQKNEMQAAHDRTTPVVEKATKKRDAALQAAQAEFQAKTVQLETQKKNSLAELEQWRVRKLEEVRKLFDAETVKLGDRATAQDAQLRQQHAADRAELEKSWSDGLKNIQEPMQEDGSSYPAWNDPIWDHWKGPTKFPATIRFGQLQVDLKSMVADVAKGVPFTLPLPDTFSVPALFAYPKQASILIHTDRPGRADSVRGMQMMMARLLTALPPGRVRFTLIDPVGLGQNFAGFMHLADYDEALVGGRIWTDSDQIDERLANLTEHMETVIQKYLRNEYRDDRRLQRPGRRIGRAVSIPGDLRFPGEFQRRRPAAAQQHRQHRLALRRVHAGHARHPHQHRQRLDPSR